MGDRIGNRLAKSLLRVVVVIDSAQAIVFGLKFVVRKQESVSVFQLL